MEYGKLRTGRPYKPVRKLRPADVFYIAGFVDGEGTISIHKDRNNYRARVMVCNTDKEICEWFMEVTGKGHISKRTWHNKKWKPGYTWILEGLQPTKEFLCQIFPYLKIKQEQATLCLGLPHLEIGYAPKIKKRNEFLRSVQGKFYKICHDLNKRGVQGV
jgi:hypothetical protein